MNDEPEEPTFNHIICKWCRTLQDLSHYKRYARKNGYSDECNYCRINKTRAKNPLWYKTPVLKYAYKCDECDNLIYVDEGEIKTIIARHRNTPTHKKEVKRRSKNKYGYYNKIYYPLKN